MTRLSPLVFVVDDDVSVREALDFLIRAAGWQPETYASAEAFLARPRALVPSCLILDVSLPDLNGLDLQKRIGTDRSDLPIIFLTGYGDVPMTVRAMKAGAVEFLTKPFRDDVLLSAISSALERSRAALEQQAEIQVLRDRFATLSPREREVMALVVSGLLNKQIGGELRISEITVKAHRGKVMHKMGADSLADLVKMAERLGTGLARGGGGGQRGFLRSPWMPGVMGIVLPPSSCRMKSFILPTVPAAYTIRRPSGESAGSISRPGSRVTWVRRPKVMASGTARCLANQNRGREQGNCGNRYDATHDPA